MVILKELTSAELIRLSGNQALTIFGNKPSRSVITLHVNIVAQQSNFMHIM